MPFTIGESRAADLFGHQLQFADTLSWMHGMDSVRAGGSVIRHTTGGSGSEPGTAVLGTFSFLNTTTAPFTQLTLADVRQYTQPVSYGVTSDRMKQWMAVAFVQDSIRLKDQLTVDAGLRDDRQTLTDAKKNVAPRLGFGWHPNGDSRLAIRGGYARPVGEPANEIVELSFTGSPFAGSPVMIGVACLVCFRGLQ